MCEANPLLCLMSIFLAWTVVNSIVYLGFVLYLLFKGDGE